MRLTRNSHGKLFEASRLEGRGRDQVNLEQGNGRWAKPISTPARTSVKVFSERLGSVAGCKHIGFCSSDAMHSITVKLLVVAHLSFHGVAFDKNSIEECARVLSENLQDTFKRVTKSDQIIQFYDQFVEPEQFDPRDELKRSKTAIEHYLQRRADFAYKAKVSLEVREVVNASDEEVNDPNSKDFIRFMSAKQGNDATTIYVHDHSLRRTKVNETRNFTLEANANFYNLPTSSIASAVHIPTPLYDRNPELLRKIDWSEIDEVYRTHRHETRDLAFQLFCSESGYMRFFPAASWFWDNHVEHLDLFDCRNTQWQVLDPFFTPPALTLVAIAFRYINAATNSKNVLIMLDMSGSMLGQRYEIAKQTTEAILETLSHNDYFNIMPVRDAEL
ncbi:unnamed protein product [Heligmosomoides polygyrus]|uniref:VWA_N domain-containing protein n=1 Tax=Heligmosomoides polygyrus TaxID=6339 RepID=A0A3P7Y425_HELPZ|nr:unnamed protein product [Heligmosomoides polygyrus]